MLFPLFSMNTSFTWAFLLCWVTLWASLRCGKAYVSSRLWVWWNVCHNFFDVCIGKAFTCVSFYVHLQVVSTKGRFYAYLPCRKPFSSKQWPDHVDLQTLPTLENFCTTSVFVGTFSRNKAFTRVRSRKLFSGYLAVGYIAKDSWLYSKLARIKQMPVWTWKILR